MILIKYMAEWYKGEFAIGMSIAAVALATSLGTGGCKYLRSMAKARDANTARLSSPMQRDLNGNNMLEKYIEINGIKYFSEIDGKNLEDSLKK